MTRLLIALAPILAAAPALAHETGARHPHPHEALYWTVGAALAIILGALILKWREK